MHFFLLHATKQKNRKKIGNIKLLQIDLRFSHNFLKKMTMNRKKSAIKKEELRTQIHKYYPTMIDYVKHRSDIEDILISFLPKNERDILEKTGPQLKKRKKSDEMNALMMKRHPITKRITYQFNTIRKILYKKEDSEIKVKVSVKEQLEKMKIQCDIFQNKYLSLKRKYDHSNHDEDNEEDHMD